MGLVMTGSALIKVSSVKMNIKSYLIDTSQHYDDSLASFFKKQLFSKSNQDKITTLKLEFNSEISFLASCLSQLELAIKDHGVYIAKELIRKCGRYNSNILKIISNPRVLLGDDPSMSFRQNFSVPGIELHELKYTILVLRHSILRMR